MSRDDPQLKLRLPQQLKDKVDQAAKDSGRSINAELVQRIEQSFLSTSDNERDALIEQQQQVIKNTLAQLDDMIARHLSFFEDNKKAP